MRESVRWCLGSFGLAVLVFLAAHPSMLGIGGPAQGPGWDATRVFWADLAFTHHAWSEGSLPLWNPYDRAGYPFVAEPQSCVFDPLTLALVLVATVVGHAPSWLIALKVVLCFGIAGAGMAMFLRTLKLPRWAVAFGVVALLLCPRMDKLKDQSALWPTIWAGWLLLAVERCMARPTPRRGLWLGVAGSLVLTAGYPPAAFRMLLLVLPYAVWRAVVALRAHDEPRAYLRALGGALALALGVVAVLGAAQVWATISVLPQTQRAELDLAHVLGSFTEPDHWRGLFGPLPNKTGLLTYGGVATVAGIIAALRWPLRGRATVLAIVGALGFLLACGEHLPLLPALSSWPGFRSFRIAGHYLVLLSITAAIVGAIGLARLAEADTPRSRGALIAGVVGVAAIAFGSRHEALVWALVVASMLAVAALTLVPPPRRSAVGWALVVLLGADLWVVGRPIADLLQPLPRDARAQTMAAALPDRTGARVADFDWARFRPGPRAAIRDLVGHRPALTDPRYLQVYQEAGRSVRVLQAMNVGLMGVHDRAPRHHHALQAVEGQPGLFRIEGAWPLAYWTAAVEVVDGPDRVLPRLRRHRNPAVVFEAEHLGDEAAAIEALAAVPRRAQPRAVAAEVLDYGLDRIELRVEAPTDGVVVVTEGYDPAWEARLDDDVVPLVRANLIVRAIRVPAGAHRITLRYRVPVVTALWTVWAIGWLVIIAFELWHRRRRA